METVSITGNRYRAIHIVLLLNVWWAQPTVKWALPFVRPTFVLFDRGGTCNLLLNPSFLPIWGVKSRIYWLILLYYAMACDLAVKSHQTAGAAFDFPADRETQDRVPVTPSTGIARGASRHPRTAQATCPLAPAGQWISKWSGTSACQRCKLCQLQG